MIESGRTRGRWSSVITLLAIAYLGLSAAQLVRTLAFERPIETERGFHPWEVAEVQGERRPFRWTRGTTAALLTPLWGPVLRLPVFLSHPDPPQEGVSFRLLVDDEEIDALRLRGNGWRAFSYYLPRHLPGYNWDRDLDGPPGAYTQPRLRVDVGGWFHVEAPPRPARPDVVRLVTGWRSPPVPRTRWIRVVTDSSFVPAELTDGDDRRLLGIGVGELWWNDELPDGAVGLYGWERQEGRPFSWTGRRASIDLSSLPGAVAPGGDLRVEFRAAHPDLEERPVRVEVFLGAELVHSVSLSDATWHELGVSGAVRDAVLSIEVDRTWSPAASGVSADARELGVALRMPRWGAAAE